jgi:hypothetical protein
MNRAIALTCACIFSLSAMDLYAQKPVISYYGIANQPFDLITLGSQAFDTAIEEITFPDSKSLLSPLLPYCVFVRNNSTSRILSLTVTYRNSLTGDVLGAHGLHFPPGSPSAMMSPGDVAFLAPMGGLARLVKSGRRGIPSATDFAARRDSVVNRFLASQQVIISLDSVITEDGFLLGADTAGRLTTNNAATDAVKSLLRELAGLSKTTAVDTLQGISSTAVQEAPSRTYSYAFAARRAQFSKQLLAEINLSTKPFEDLLAEIAARAVDPEIRRK